MTTEAEKELMNINDDTKTKVQIPYTNKSYNIGYQKPFTTERVTSVMLDAEPETPEAALTKTTNMSKRSKAIHKAASLIILNNFFAIKFLHPLFWRWLYYVKGYTAEHLFPVISEAKKKVPLASFSYSMVLLAMMMKTQKTMTTKEAKTYRAELLAEQERNSGN